MHNGREEVEVEDIVANVTLIDKEGDISPRQTNNLISRSKKGHKQIPLQVRTKSSDRFSRSNQ